MRIKIGIRSFSKWLIAILLYDFQNSKSSHSNTSRSKIFTNSNSSKKSCRRIVWVGKVELCESTYFTHTMQKRLFLIVCVYYVNTHRFRCVKLNFTHGVRKALLYTKSEDIYSTYTPAQIIMYMKIFHFYFLHAIHWVSLWTWVMLFVLRL